MIRLISTKNRTFIGLVIPSETRKSQLIHIWFKIGFFQSEFDKTFIFLSTFPLCDVMQNEIESLEFFQGGSFEFTDYLKNSGTKYLLILTIFLKRFAIRKHLLILPSLEDLTD